MTDLRVAYGFERETQWIPSDFVQQWRCAYSDRNVLVLHAEDTITTESNGSVSKQHIS